MVARQLILNASYTPDQLKAIEKAFDEAWTRIAPSVSDRRQGCRRAFACEALGQMDFADPLLKRVISCCCLCCRANRAENATLRSATSARCLSTVTKW